MSTLSGKKTLVELDETLGRARGTLASVDAEFGGARAMLVGLKQSELGLYARLATLRLLSIEQGSVLDALDQADRKAAEILKQREAEVLKLDREIEAAEAALAGDEARRTEQQAVVAAASEALDAAEAEAQSALEVDEAYRAQLERTEQTDFVADQAEDKAAAARDDRVEKGKPYEADPLFSYLWARGYGTSKYRAWPLARWLDGRVATLCDYEGARRNYALLTDIPVRLAEHAAAMRDEFEREADALTALEDAAAKAAGVPERAAELEAAESRLSEIDAAITGREDEIRALVAERGAFAAGEDTYYLRSIEVLSEAMRRESIEFLRERAARTREREDDDLVQRLTEIDREIDRIEQNLDELRRLHERDSKRVNELEDVRRRFKSERFDDPLSEFVEGALIALVLKQFLGGAAGSGDVWNTIRRQQRKRRVKADPNFGTMRFPKSPKTGPWRMPKGGGFGRGGGFGGGGFKTGGGFKGGGFKTGGGF
jgi:hypothetical protein